MKKITDLLQQKTPFQASSATSPKTRKKRITERGELLRYFSEKMHFSIPRTAKHLEGCQLKDLYYIQSVCKDAEKQGIPFEKVFWYNVKILKGKA